MLHKIKIKTYKILLADGQQGLLSKVFDIFIIALILFNVFVVILDTFDGVSNSIRNEFRHIEVFSVIIFTIEYFMRLWTADFIFPELSPTKARLKYIFSFMAIIDLLSILPFYLPFIIKIDLRVLRMLRLLRLLRILKINRYTKALTIVGNVLKNKATQLISSMFVVVILMIITSVLMYNIEHDAQPTVFVNAFSGLWWATCTLTTVGYGDICPITPLGKLLGATIALLGIGLVAVPTGIISAGFVEEMEREKEEAQKEKNYCPYCGEKLKKRGA